MPCLTGAPSPTFPQPPVELYELSHPFIPVSNAMQVVLQFEQQDGSNALNEFWVQRSAAWTPTLMTTMLDAFISWFSTGDGTHAYRGSVGTDNALVAAKGRDYTTQSGYVVIDQAGLPVSGDGGGEAAGLGATWVVTARTGLAGRSYRGRTYLVGLPSGFWSDYNLNEVNGEFAGHVVLAFNSLVDAVTTADAEAHLVVCSRYHNGGFRDEGVTTPILSYGYSTLSTDFQRRRAPAHNVHG